MAKEPIMPPERMTHAVNFLIGEVHALLNFTQLLAASHPDPARLLLEMEKFEQKGLAQMENILSQSEAHIEGFHFAVDSLRTAVKVGLES